MDIIRYLGIPAVLFLAFIVFCISRGGKNNGDNNSSAGSSSSGGSNESQG